KKPEEIKAGAETEGARVGAGGETKKELYDPSSQLSESGKQVLSEANAEQKNTIANSGAAVVSAEKNEKGDVTVKLDDGNTITIDSNGRVLESTILSPVFRFDDGTSATDLYYRFVGEWQWSPDAPSKNNWVRVKIAENIEQFYNTITEKDLTFINTLQAKNYQEGLNLLINRVLQDKEGGFYYNPSLWTEFVELKIPTPGDQDFTNSIWQTWFEVRPKRSGVTSIYIRYSGGWQWSPTKALSKFNWIDVPELVVPSGKYEGEGPVEENQKLITLLEGKTFEQGARILFDFNYDDFESRYGIGDISTPETTETGATDAVGTTQEVIVHEDIIASTFWVGEPGQESSAWIQDWISAFGGIDDPNNRKGNQICPNIPELRQNPFYVALPAKPENMNDEEKRLNVNNYGKGSWVKIVSGGKVVYAQWEDVGPWNTNDYSYVFGNARPVAEANPNTDKRDAIDLSPAATYVLSGQTSNTITVTWNFVSEPKTWEWRYSYEICNQGKSVEEIRNEINENLQNIQELKPQPIIGTKTAGINKLYFEQRIESTDPVQVSKLNLYDSENPLTIDPKFKIRMPSTDSTLTVKSEYKGCERGVVLELWRDDTFFDNRIGNLGRNQFVLNGLVVAGKKYYIKANCLDRQGESLDSITTKNFEMVIDESDLPDPVPLPLPKGVNEEDIN
ncbi:MAG: hypothetical protein AABY22_06550, partial [Nanoarchaeota archaeon]